MRKSKITSLILAGVMLLAALSLLAADKQPDNGSDAIIVKAAELVGDKQSRIDKLIALQEFVRDQVAEVKTRYG